MTEEYARLESFDRDMECEHTHNPNPPTGDLVGCDKQAEYAIASPLWSGETRTKYCPAHVIDGLQFHLDKLSDSD